ncbi:Peroxisomal membrane protein [Nymphaea thermarum]|nr:Peroxisomal membrane protein [Nymphaea thermarum]
MDEKCLFKILLVIGVDAQAVTVGVLAGCSDSISQKLSGIQRLQFKRLLLKVVCLSCPLKLSTDLLSLLLAYACSDRTANFFTMEQCAVYDILWCGCGRGIFLNLRAHTIYLKLRDL